MLLTLYGDFFKGLLRNKPMSYLIVLILQHAFLFNLAVKKKSIIALHNYYLL